MNRSDSIAAIAAALSKAQGVMGGAYKGKANPHFKSIYADMASVVEAIKEPLSVNGISYVQVTEPSEKSEVRVETVLMHSSGEWISGTIAVPVIKADAQGYGSALTYARRYALMAIVGLAADDDDGNRGSGGKGKDLGSDKEMDADPALIAEAEREAGTGTDAYRAFWKRITPDQRGAIGTRHEALKEAAKAASEATRGAT